MLKKETDLMRREEKEENIIRISKAQQYKKSKVLEKIESDKSRANSIRKEKDKLQETRFFVRREADTLKQQIVESFE